MARKLITVPFSSSSPMPGGPRWALFKCSDKPGSSGRPGGPESKVCSCAGYRFQLSLHLRRQQQAFPAPQASRHQSPPLSLDAWPRLPSSWPVNGELSQGEEVAGGFLQDRRRFRERCLLPPELSRSLITPPEVSCSCMGMQLCAYTKYYRINLKKKVTILFLIYTQRQEVWFLCNSYISAVRSQLRASCVPAASQGCDYLMIKLIFCSGCWLLLQKLF